MSLRGGVIGVGYLGNFHAQKMKALASELGFVFSGVCDSDENLLKTRTAELGVKGYSKIAEFLQNVDLVTIATTTPSHFELAKLCLTSKKHVNVEKPICLSSRQGQELIDLANQNKLVLTVGHSERFSKVFSEVSTNLRKPKYIEMIRHAPFKRRGSEVSVVFDLMIHDLDLLLSLDSSDYKIQFARHGILQGGGSDADWVAAGIIFASGLAANISVNRVSPVMTRTMRAIESQRIVQGNFQNGEVEIGTMSANGEVTEFRKIEGLKSDNLMLETRNFVLSCQGKEKPLVTGVAGHRALKCAEDIVALGRGSLE